jgi:hypothetical protein
LCNYFIFILSPTKFIISASESDSQYFLSTRHLKSAYIDFKVFLVVNNLAYSDLLFAFDLESYQRYFSFFNQSMELRQTLSLKKELYVVHFLLLNLSNWDCLHIPWSFEFFYFSFNVQVIMNLLAGQNFLFFLFL